MIRDKKSAEEFFHNVLFSNGINVKCEKCGTDLVCEHNDMEKVMFEPYKKEFEVTMFSCDENGKYNFHGKNETVNEIISSDISKDIFTYKCPICGAIKKLTREEHDELVMNSRNTQLDGKKHILFDITNKEFDEIEKFKSEHKHEDTDCGAIGGHYTYEIVPTSIGNSVSIKCNICGEEKNVTDYGNW